MKNENKHITRYNSWIQRNKNTRGKEPKVFFFGLLQELARVLWEKEHRRPRPTLGRKLTPAAGHVANTPQQLSFANAHKQLHRVFVERIFLSNYVSYSCVSKFYVVYLLFI